MNDVVFVEMKEEYIPKILQIYNYYVNQSTATFHMHELSAEEMKEILYYDDPRFSSFVILHHGILCGYVILSRYSMREAYHITAEVTIYLDREYSGRGIGRDALNFIEKTAKERHFQVLIAKICGENTGSIRLFEKAGYVKCGHYTAVGYKFGRLLDAVSYQKNIGSNQNLL
jgi:L-amino acid N-acyltransferase YncA